MLQGMWDLLPQPGIVRRPWNWEWGVVPRTTREILESFKNVNLSSV